MYMNIMQTCTCGAQSHFKMVALLCGLVRLELCAIRQTEITRRDDRDLICFTINLVKMNNTEDFSYFKLAPGENKAQEIQEL